MGYGMRRPYDYRPFSSPRLGMEIVEYPAGALGAHPRNLAEIGDRSPFDLLQGSEMMQQGTFTRRADARNLLQTGLADILLAKLAVRADDEAVGLVAQA